MQIFIDDKNIKNRGVKSRKIIKILIFILLVLMAILNVVPGIIFHSARTSVSEINKDVIQNLIFQYKTIYIWSFIGLSMALSLLFVLFPNDFKGAKDTANKKLYDESDLKQKIPPIVLVSIIGGVILLFLLCWLFVK